MTDPGPILSPRERAARAALRAFQNEVDRRGAQSPLDNLHEDIAGMAHSALDLGKSVLAATLRTPRWLQDSGFNANEVLGRRATPGAVNELATGDEPAPRTDIIQRGIDTNEELGQRLVRGVGPLTQLAGSFMVPMGGSREAAENAAAKAEHLFEGEARFPARAAIMTPEGRIYTGANHYDAVGLIPKHVDLSNAEEGFVDRSAVGHPANNAPASSWMTRQEGERLFNRENGYPSLAEGEEWGTTEGFQQGHRSDAHTMPDEYRLGQMNLERQTPMTRLQYRTQIKGYNPHQPNDALGAIALNYRDAAGLPQARPEAVAKADPAFHARVADAYHGLTSNPDDPQVQAAYSALMDEVRAQHAALTHAGFQIIPSPENPYATSAEMMRDVRTNKRLFVYAGNADHPLLSNEDNVMLRGVHDMFGHAMAGNQFGPTGEERAFRDHATMFSPLARQALATETRGQNSWVNFFGEHPTMPAPSRPYAAQKAALLPSWAQEPSYAGLPAPTAVDEQVAATAAGTGGTTHPVTGASPSIGYAVADPAHTEVLDNVTPEAVAGFRLRHADAIARPGAHLGTWRDPSTGALELNVTHVLQDPADANRLGYARGQRAVGDLAAYARGENGDIPVTVPDPIRGDRDRPIPGFEPPTNKVGARSFRLFSRDIPGVESFGAAALAGQEHRNWYTRAMQSGRSTFGPDWDRFAALIAGLSPQQPVEKNLTMAADIWQPWDAAGRPTDPASLRRLINGNVGIASRENNAALALSTPDPTTLSLGGNKVFSFHRNLLGDADRVTLDTWMAKLANINPANLDKAGAYNAYSRRIRETADWLTQKTGRPWTPAETQAAAWSWAQAGADPSGVTAGASHFGDLLGPISERLGLPAPVARPLAPTTGVQPNVSALDALLRNIEEHTKGNYIR